jgi:hypothetical protein
VPAGHVAVVPGEVLRDASHGWSPEHSRVLVGVDSLVADQGGGLSGTRKDLLAETRRVVGVRRPRPQDGSTTRRDRAVVDLELAAGPGALVVPDEAVALCLAPLVRAGVPGAADAVGGVAALAPAWPTRAADARLAARGRLRQAWGLLAFGLVFLATFVGLTVAPFLPWAGAALLLSPVAAGVTWLARGAPRWGVSMPRWTVLCGACRHAERFHPTVVGGTCDARSWNDPCPCPGWRRTLATVESTPYGMYARPVG